VPSSRVIDFLAAGRSVASRSAFHEENNHLPDVPVLPETLLVMELHHSENSVDLRGFSEAVLGDVGATIRILRMIGQESGGSDHQPERIEDCVADLGAEACMRIAMQGMLSGAEHHDEIVEVWGHSTEIARHCRQLAEEKYGFNPSQAYLAGLLHDIGALPGILGWGQSDLSGDYALSALKLAMRWCFPGFLKSYFYEAYLPGENPQWTAMMTEAHLAADRTWAWCPLNELCLRTSARGN